MSHSAASFFASASSFFFSPLLSRQFSSNTSSPGFTSTPSTQLRDQRHLAAEQFAQALGDGRQRVLGLEFAFGRAAEVRSHHHRGAGLQRHLDAGHRRADARVFGDVARIVLRHVEVGADEHALAGQAAVGHDFVKSKDFHRRAPTTRTISRHLLE